jgi:hypothetical protein
LRRERARRRAIRGIGASTRVFVNRFGTGRARANVERNGATVAARARDARRGRGRRRMRRFRASRTTDGGTGTERRRDGSKNHNAWSWRGWNASATNGTARRRKSARRFPE